MLDTTSPTGIAETLKKTYASATVGAPGVGEFREFVLVFQTDLSLQYNNGTMVPNIGVAFNSAESGHKAVNYRTEPVWHRMGYAPETTPQAANQFTFFDTAFSNSAVGGDPVTPTFQATSGDQVRFRMVNPAGHGQQNTFGIHGHIWQELPYENASRTIGDNQLSEYKGAHHGHGPTNHFDILLQNGAGGKAGVTGDYMYRDYVPWMLQGGIWGILRVTP